MGAILRVDREYVTGFPVVEASLSQGGLWLNGATDGLDWCNSQVIAGGIVCGTQTGVVGPPYNDTTSLLTGAWSPNQDVIATVFSSSQNTGAFEEVEIRLRSTLTAHVNRGYEISYRNTSDGSQYVGLVRWNGALNDFSVLIDMQGGASGAPPITNGCQIRARAIGTVIDFYHRVTPALAWSLINSYDIRNDPVQWRDGNPGPGFWNRNGSNTNHGFTYFSARGFA